MIHLINITTPTREGDTYPSVAINEYPIVYIDDETAENILDDIDLINVLKSKIKNVTTYKNAVINIRTLDDDFNTTDTSFKLTDKVTLQEWS